MTEENLFRIAHAALCRFAEAAALLDEMAPQYGCAADEFSYAALCVAVQQSDLAGHEAVAEAARIEAAIEAMGESDVHKSAFAKFMALHSRWLFCFCCQAGGNGR